LMAIAQVGPTPLRLASDVPAVQVAIGTLRAFKRVGDPLDLSFDRGVAPVRERVTGRFDPLADVGVPEHLGRQTVLADWNTQRRRWLRNRERIENPVLLELLVLARDRFHQHGIEPLTPKTALDPHRGE